ncbi:hypothetical protein H8S90_10455 [Olivibacter sp. SDN3]|uniref:hypothetical protein n=1 Tax=Olivibacter sp. SDN3 TaxID=2764720 RepID=UPI00165135CA|nr:hypothetical protein [Olivibacter sp. SDN3]QNL51955.1 hypothetical protein H8S90_10455 [Olivibacter sp. SDN3]
MIRIYLDWNVVSNLKKPDFFGIKDFIELNKHRFIFPYSQAHFSDLMKSNKQDNPYFQVDLNTLTSLAGKHLLCYENGMVTPKFGTPGMYYKDYDDGLDNASLFDMEANFNLFDEMGREMGVEDIGTHVKKIFDAIPSLIEITDKNKDTMKLFFPGLKEGATQWDVFKESGFLLGRMLEDRIYYKNLRKTISGEGFHLDRNSGNWNVEDVIDNINKFLRNIGLDKDFLGFMDYIFELRNENPDDMTYFSGCYSMLDMMGYKSDKLPKTTDTAMNIYTDAHHAYYAGHCDYFIVGDENLAKKAKVLYKLFDVKTVVLHPSEMVQKVGEVMVDFSVENIGFLNAAFELIKRGMDFKEYPELSENGSRHVSYRLPAFYFDFFNYVSWEEYPDKNALLITFKKRKRNFSKFYYYTEIESIVRLVVSFFDRKCDFDLENITQDIKNGKEVSFSIMTDFGLVALNFEEVDGLKRPQLVYVVSVKY